MISFFDIYSCAHSTIAILGMLFNALLVYLALFQTPKLIRSYATLIANFGLADLAVCFFDLFVQQRIIPAGRSLAYISNGLCKHYLPTACYVGYSLMLHCFAHSLWSLLLSFSYRYYILLHPAPTRPKLVLIISLVYLPSLLQWISFLWAQDDPTEIIEILHLKYPSYDLEGHVVTGTKDIICFSALFTIFHMTLPITPVYVCILVLRRKIINRLSIQGVNITKNTKDLHSQLLMALTYQALLPGFYLFSAISYGLGQLGIYNHIALEYFTFSSILFIPFLSPISSFIFVNTYRRLIIRAFQKLLGIERTYSTSNRVHTITSQMDGFV